MVFDHLGFNVTDLQKTKDFLVQATRPLAMSIVQESEGWAMIGRVGEGALWFGSFGAFVIGPDGHNFEAVCHSPEA